MALHDQPVELAEQREGRSVAAPAGRVRAHPGERESALRLETDLPERVFHERGGLHFLEAELGISPDLLAEPDDLVAPPVDGVVDSLLQSIRCHRVILSAFSGPE